MDFLKKLDRVLTAMEKAFVGAGIFITTILVFSAVITRYFFGFSPSWIEELTEYTVLWVVFVGAGLCIKKEEHVNVDIIFHALSERSGRILMGILCILSAIFMAYFGYASYGLVMNVRETQQTSASMDWLPMYIVYGSAVVGSILMILEFLKMSAGFFSGQSALKK